MGTIKTVLTCIDLSEYSMTTLEYALELVRGTPARVVVFNVINQRDLDGVVLVSRYYPDTVNMENYTAELKKDRDQRLRQFIKNHFFNDKSKMTIRIDTGVPYECILNAAKEENADLIVMANKGRGNLSRVFFGSAAEKVFRHSDIPVFSVRDKNKFKRRIKDV